MTTTAAQAVEQIDSAYFGEEDIMGIQARLIEKGYINPDQVFEEDADLAVNPVILAKALDRLVDELISQVVEYPEEMLFGSCGGSFKSEFERAVQAVRASGMTKEELRAMR